MFIDAFVRAFGSLRVDDAAAEGASSGAQAEGYEDIAQMTRVALQWWDTRGAKEALFIFRAALWPQQRLMHTMLDTAGVAFDVSNFSRRLQGVGPVYAESQKNLPKTLKLKA